MVDRCVMCGAIVPEGTHVCSDCVAKENDGGIQMYSSRETESNKGGGTVGIGFTGLLAIAFIVLKLCGVIKWSWVWVLSPVWIPLALIIVVLVVYLIVSAIKDKKKK